MRESTIERYLVQRCKDLSILCPKFVSPGTAGVNDRLAIPPFGLPVWFIETKAPKGELEPLQRHWKTQLLMRGQLHALLDTHVKVDAWIAQQAHAINEIDATMPF